MKKMIDPRYLMVLLLVAVSLSASADCGSTDYSGSMGRLYDMVVYVLNMCVFKSVLVLVGSCLFLIGATIVMPAFFGFSYGNTSTLKFW